jgi:hypothetical protein
MISLADGAIRRAFASYRAASKAVPVLFRSGLGRSEDRKGEQRLVGRHDVSSIALYCVSRNGAFSSTRDPIELGAPTLASDLPIFL